MFAFRFLILLFIFLLVSCTISQRASNNKPNIELANSIKQLSCRPIYISNTGPIGAKMMSTKSIEFLDYKFVRSDVGDPDGVLKVYKSGRLSCKIDISLLSQIRLDPKNNIVLLHSYSGSASFWELYSVEKSSCIMLGKLKSAQANRFESKLRSLPECS